MKFESYWEQNEEKQRKKAESGVLEQNIGIVLASHVACPMHFVS
jgi:hypothetical protein